MMIKFFYFTDGSNPYMTYTEERVYQMVMKYNPEMIDNNTFRIDMSNYLEPVKTREAKKWRFREFAIHWHHRAFSGDFEMSYDDLIQWQAFFATYGQKLGLLREFRENGIC